jgi:alpha-L-rhamnosidase
MTKDQKECDDLTRILTSTHIEEWFYAGLAGIRPDPDRAALRRVFIEPQPVGDVRWVKASWESVR